MFHRHWSKQWRLGMSEFHEAEFAADGSRITTSSGRRWQVGPLVITRYAPKPVMLRILGTNELTPRTRLYDSAFKKQFGIVLATDPAYEFEDGEIRSGVLIKAENGVKRWVPRTNLSKVLVPAD